MAPAAVVALLKGDHLHGDKLSDKDLTDRANFVVCGQLDWSALVADKKSTGNAEAGKQVF